MSSKNVGIRIRVEKDLREAFRDACVAENMFVSDVLRDFMRLFAAQHGQGKQASLFAEKFTNDAATNSASSVMPDGTKTE